MKTKKPGRIKTAAKGLKESGFIRFMAAGVLTATAINPFRPRIIRYVSGGLAALTLYKTGRKLGLRKIEREQVENNQENNQ